MTLELKGWQLGAFRAARKIAADPTASVYDKENAREVLREAAAGRAESFSWWLIPNWYSEDLDEEPA